MVRKDYEKGGFLINRVRPALCYTKEGRLFIAYDNFTLKTIFSAHDIVKCVGAWPGKRDTDIFVLDPAHYKDTPAPPEKYKDIDQAQQIILMVNKNGEFQEVVWTTLDEGEKSTEDRYLYDYIIKSGRPHEVKTCA